MSGIKIDEERYSRQLLTLGKDAMVKMAQTSVLVSGMGGLGVEIAKNLILTGFKAVAVQDVSLTTYEDLSAQFYLTEQDIGKNRAASCVQKLAELNPGVAVSSSCETLSTDYVNKFNIVVMTDNSAEELKTIGDFCHANGIKFVVAKTAGLFGMIFNDFGEQVETMKLLDCYEGPKKLNFKPYSKAVANPEFLVSDYAKMVALKTPHYAFEALDQFITENNRKPSPYNKGDLDKFMKIISKIADPEENVDDKILEKFCFTCAGVVCPMNGVIGGMAAVEVIKACTGILAPIKQFFYFDSAESLPDNWNQLTEEDCAASGSRYDGQIKVFGSAIQKKLANASAFITGAGAIGCEYLKNMAMMGLASGSGKLTVTDAQKVETANLCHQFLYRKENVDSYKSTLAATAVQTLNPNVNIEALLKPVGPESERVFDDSFFQGLDFVATALDNINARLYMDKRCVALGTPMLETGMHGIQGHIQVIIPGITESYSALETPPGKPNEIIPAIVTTVAIVGALACLEIYKLLDNPKDIDKFRCGFINSTKGYVLLARPTPFEE